ncbi:phosphoribosylformylglycinamidine synthase subunit PurL [Elusimicrobium minutum]|uniref:phosphoribosylformylglycinamidine synthase subunit PurL n=1 Tax=Elusimicrobium minutum TaxID=423605 RepID=UPI0001618D3D|nr:phosphoribosylformylglycinamidine synthase subunit PurL [Elusimicrobium minutum]
MEENLRNFDKLSKKELFDLQARAGWSLVTEEMVAAQDYFKSIGRAPTQAELETIAQTWSEHCKHKTFNGPVTMVKDGKKEVIKDGLFKTTIYKATKKLNKKWCLSVFKDNAGVVEFGQGKKWALAFKAETHNHPCAVEPYGGAETGVGGVIRDILGVGLGAKPVVNTDIFCFADPDYKAKLPAAALHPKRIFRGVVDGVRDYGNRMGIPTASGAIWFDDRYALNPLVFVGTIGIMPTWAIEKSVKAGDLVVSIGGRTGRDGLHGATFSSANIEDASEVSAVQIGHAINEKKVLDAMLRLRDKRLYRGCTDCGAGGFSSAIGELGGETGVRVDLSKAVLKESKIKPWEIWVSESQERMILSVPPKNLKEVKKILEAEDCEYSVMGEFTNTGRLEVYFGKEKIVDLSNDFLHGGVPKMMRKAVWNTPKTKPSRIKEMKNYGAVLHKTLAHLNTCSREDVIRQYDHEVQSGTVVKPLQGVTHDGPGDATVIWPASATGNLKDYNGFAVTHGLNPAIGKIDPYQMALNCCDEAVRNLLCVGADINKTAFLDNFCWGSPENPKLLGELVLCAKGCYDGAMAYSAPFISGKDSFYNQSKDAKGNDVAIPSTILISATAPVHDIRKSVTMDFKEAASSVYVVGVTKDEFGGSVTADILGLKNIAAPKVDAKAALKTYQKVYKVISGGLVNAAHDISQGGLAAALSEMCFSGAYGAEINLKKVLTEGKLSDGQILFSESACRLVLEVNSENEKAFLKALKGVKLSKIGQTNSTPSLIIKGQKGAEVISEKLSKLKKSWRDTLKGVL